VRVLPGWQLVPLSAQALLSQQRARNARVEAALRLLHAAIERLGWGGPRRALVSCLAADLDRRVGLRIRRFSRFLTEDACWPCSCRKRTSLDRPVGEALLEPASAAADSPHWRWRQAADYARRTKASRLLLSLWPLPIASWITHGCIEPFLRAWRVLSARQSLRSEPQRAA